MIETKSCTKCGIEKPLDGFYLESTGKPAAACKECIKSAKNKRYAENIDRMRANARRYRANDIETHRKREREYSRRNAAARDARVKAFYLKNPHKSSEYNQRYYHSDKGRRQRIRWYHDVLKHREDFKVATAARNMLKRTLMATGGMKNTSTKGELGYSPSTLKQHIEKQFIGGMSWDNYGEWHIDHIIPVAEMIRLGITCPKKINALDNLRPVWASDNLSRGDRFDLAIQCQP